MYTVRIRSAKVDAINDCKHNVKRLQAQSHQKLHMSSVRCFQDAFSCSIELNDVPRRLCDKLLLHVLRVIGAPWPHPGASPPGIEV
jgi:hypothetical protein